MPYEITQSIYEHLGRAGPNDSFASVLSTVALNVPGGGSPSPYFGR